MLVLLLPPCVGAAQAADAGNTANFLLVDGGAPAGQPRLTGCDRAMSDLHAALDKAGARNTVLIAPTAGALRQALLGFGGSGSGPGDAASNAVLFCGYAAEAGGNVFALGSDFSAHDDPALSAVSVRAFSRMTGGKNGLVMLDLHPMAVEGASVSAIAGALGGAAGAWSTDNSLPGTRIVVTDRQPGDASLIDKAARSGASTPAAIAQAVGTQAAGTRAAPASPAPAPATTATATLSAPATSAENSATPAGPVPTTAPTAKPDHGSSPEHSGSASAGSAGGDVGAGPVVANATATKPDAAAPADAGAGTIPLAPKPAADPAAAAAARKRVHVDPAIRRIQVALLARGLFTGRVNGVNGADTQRGIQHFQAMLGHPTTGQLTADETKQLTGG